MSQQPSKVFHADAIAHALVTVPTRPQALRRSRRRPKLDEAALAVALPFQSVELVATGGMSLVYRAYDRELRRPVAVKLLRPALAIHEQLAATFVAEYDVARRISHDGVVRVHRIAEVETVPYLVMDWVDGATLASAAETPRSYAHVAGTGALIAHALAAAHAADVVHCDVKPDNIMVLPTAAAGDLAPIRLIDFGVARVGGQLALGTGLVTGTPLYMAPEQWRGAPEPASDVYALGCVLYELVAGRAPFAGIFADVMTAHLEREPAPLASLRPDVPPALADLVHAMLAKEPSDRPERMADVARQLAAIACELRGAAAP